MADLLTRGALARRSNVKISTVRFYQRLGLISAAGRARNGYLYFEPQVVRHIQFVQSAKDLGFTLEEVRDLLTMRVSSGRTCADVKSIAQEKINSVNGKIRSLKQIRKALRQLEDSCSGQGPVGDCPILEALGSGDLRL